MHSRLWTWKMEQIACLLQGDGFLFLPRTYGSSFKLITSSQQYFKRPKSTCFYKRNRLTKIILKKACSCQFSADINANDANGCYPLCSMLTYVLDSEISPENNVVKISINFLRRSYWRRKNSRKSRYLDVKFF